MLTDLQDLFTSLAALLCGFAVGGAWVGVIVVPNASFDQLDESSADQHVRAVLKNSSTPIAGALLAATAFAVLGGAFGAGAVSALAAFGFFSNRWTLAPHKSSERPSNAGHPQKRQRMLAVALSLSFGLAATAAAIMALLQF